MSDLIDRQLVLDRINKQREHLRPYLYPQDKIGDSAYRICAEFVERIPSAEPEIIRCKDCKHQVKKWRDDKRLKDKGYWVYGCMVISDVCGCWALFGQDDEFCSEAERREDE